MEILHQIKLENTIVAVGRHQGMDIAPDKIMFDQEKSILNQLSPRKKSEWLASRELLFRIAKLPERVECLYDDFGKPYLKGINNHISVSHSEEWCSAMMSDKSCGVDIQVYSDTVQRISNRFLSEQELTEISKVKNKLHFLHLYWGAKECMYKAYGKRKLEFRSHIYVRSIHTEHCTAVGEIRYEDIHLLYDIHYRILPEAAWVFCLQRSAHDSADQPGM
ncbi:MAG: 4'-phosphopantetheinyl transferase superfamily protein [Saprospiraceae bacterium]